MEVKRYIRKRFFVLCLPVFVLVSMAWIASPVPDNADEAIAYLDKMQRAISSNKTIKCEMKKAERWDGKLVTAAYKIKAAFTGDQLQKLYIYNKSPEENKGVEILYIKGQYGGKCLVKPNGFPYMSVKLDPEGEQLRKKGMGHHSCLSVGFKYMGRLIAGLRQKFKGKEKQCMRYHGMINYEGKQCHKIELFNPDFKFVNYTVKSGEDCISIANKLLIGEDMIVQKNPGVDWYDDVSAGQVIKVPNSYAKKVYLILDKDNYLPVEQIIYDDEGLYEHYRYTKLQANCCVSDAEFKSDFKDYNF